MGLRNLWLGAWLELPSVAACQSPEGGQSPRKDRAPQEDRAPQRTEPGTCGGLSWNFTPFSINYRDHAALRVPVMITTNA